MPSIARFDGIVIFIYGLDHNPPHFHAKYAEHIVKLSIEDLTVIAGDMPRPQLREVVRWAGNNREYLKQCWNAAAAGEAMP